jgi:ribosome recycling factor
MSKDQQCFLDQAVADLTQDGKIIPVRLALFAEMTKGKTWSPVTLRNIGGTEGIGVTFLEETFSAPQANPKHRLHRKAAQLVLNALLPEVGTNIKGKMMSESALQEIAGYVGRPRQFFELIHILDNELRLMTPTALDETEGDDETTPFTERNYQLTHDFLVGSLQEWLYREQRETRRGRALMMMKQRYSIWKVKEERRFLPPFTETLTILLHIRRRDRSAHINTMLNLSLSRALWRSVCAIAVALVATIPTIYVLTLYGPPRGANIRQANWDPVIKDTVRRLGKQLAGIRTGKISRSFIQTVRIDWRGSPVPIGRFGVIEQEGDRILIMTSDERIVPSIITALKKTRLNAYALSPTTVSVSEPPISGEQRREIARHIEQLGEQAKIAIRTLHHQQQKGLESSDPSSLRSLKDKTDAATAEIKWLVKQKIDEVER